MIEGFAGKSAEGIPSASGRSRHTAQLRTGDLAALRSRRAEQCEWHTSRCTRPVRFHIIHLSVKNPSLVKRLFDYMLPRLLTRHRQPCACAVLVHRGTTNDAPDPVSVCLGVTESLERDNAASLAAHIAVGGGVEGLAASGARIPAFPRSSSSLSDRIVCTPPARARSVSPSCTPRLPDVSLACVIIPR